MKKTIQFLFIVVLFASCTEAQTKKHTADMQTKAIVQDTAPSYYTYGLPDPYYSRAEETVFGRYGVWVQRVAGCEVNDSLIKTVKEHNDLLFATLRKKYPGITEDAVIQEMQDHVTVTKSIEATIQRTLKRKLAAITPLHYSFINWKEDTVKNQYLVDLYANAYEIKKADTLLWHLKVNPATDYVLIKTKEGAWNECLK